MRWFGGYKNFGSHREVIKFAWLPTAVDGHTVVWLERYVSRQNWVDGLSCAPFWAEICRRAL